MTDSELIDKLGGPAALARALGLTPERSRVQRVHNWRKRGIPAQIWLDHADTLAEMQRQAGLQKQQPVGAHAA